MPRSPRHNLILIVLIGILGFFGYLQAFPNGLLVTAVVVAVFLRFAQALDEGVPLEFMGALLAAAQWLVGPFLSYRLDVAVDRYQMYVEPGIYFSFALPGTCAFICGLLAFPGKPEEARLLPLRDSSRDFEIGVSLLLISVTSQFASGYLPDGLAFFLHLVSQLRYIAAIYFLYSKHSLRWLMIALAMSQLLVRSAESAMFHDLILWVGLLSCYWYFTRRRTLLEKTLFLTGGFLFVTSIQTIKGEYRDKVWSGEDPSLVEVAYDVLIDRMEFTERSALENAIVRMNQGWIISAVLRHVPVREPFANGETLWEAVEAAALPRFLAPGKKKAGGQDNFRRFTGLALADTTSMGISPLGEAYANFGKENGVLFMLLWGTAFGLGIGTIRQYGFRDPTILIWTSLIFYQAIKAETEIVVVLNQLIKGSIVALGCYWVIHHYFLGNAGIVRTGKPVLQPIQTAARFSDIQRH